MLLMMIALVALTALYAGALLLLGSGLRKLKPGYSLELPKVSVIIAARNEETHIATCLRALLNQTYPNAKRQFIVVDDRSEDRTADIVRSFSERYKNILLLQIKDRKAGIAPKKRALDSGIRRATGEIIMTTDADCQPGRFWIAEMVKFFEPDVGMIAGFCPYHSPKAPAPFWKRILSLDYFAMASVAAASAGLNVPISCCGGNLAYRKKVYDQIGGFKAIANWVSGDDDFFLEEVRERTNWKIHYAVLDKTFVPTASPENFSDFFQQRLRYASKGRHYKPPVTLALSAVFLMNLFIVAGIPFLVNPNVLAFWSLGILIKGLAEYTFLKRSSRTFRLPFQRGPFLFTFLIHPVYIVTAVILSLFLNFSWKGERYSKKINPTPCHLTNSKLS